ncbi:MAG: hypothetical protein L0Y58_05535 [Verrucomicrobia subdivision 3 bacterium]|nr:hypothetical protein [Limisphaerales bacterium]
MQRCLAIAALTWKAAFRFRLFWVLTSLLLGSVVLLPLLLKDDGTARGFTQILLTYTLSTITALLGLATLWLACGILARDIEECQLQIVAVKPIPRWQIWLGKWLGLVVLDLTLLAVAGSSVYALLHWRSSRLPERERAILRNEIMVARASMKPPTPDLEPYVQRAFEERVRENAVPPAEQEELKKQLREMFKLGVQAIGPGVAKNWTLDLGFRKAVLRDEPLFVRLKFYVAQTNASGTYVCTWQIGPPGQIRTMTMPMAAESYHEFAIPPNLFDDQGRLFVRLINRENTTLVVPLEDGFEVLYREGGFGLNFIRGLLIIACWLALLAAIGLASATFLSFPVAAFFSASLLFVILSSGTLSNVVTEGTVFGLDHESGKAAAGWLDLVLLPIFKGMLSIINLVKGFSPVDALSTGRSITWFQVFRAIGQIVLFLGGIAAAAGMIILTRRELATAQPQV